MSTVFMEMAEMALQVPGSMMEWHLPRTTKIMIKGATATVQLLMNMVVEVLGGGIIVEWQIQMASILGRQHKLQSPWLGTCLAILGSV